MDLKPSVNSDPRRKLPSVDRLIREASRHAPDLPGWALARAAREQVDHWRRQLLDPAGSPRGEEIGAGRDPGGGDGRGSGGDGADGADAFGRGADAFGRAVQEVVRRARDLARRHPRGVLNATGVLIHTNLGRAPLAPAALEAIGETARGYSDLELDLATGRRGARLGSLEAKLIALSGAESAHVVNNCAAARDRGLPLVEDLGSGTLLDLRGEGLAEESFAPARLELGADLVCFSGDKLLGGPQGGILLGRKTAMDALRQNPLARALRVDKLTLAALDATLDLLLDPSRCDEIPVVAGLRAEARTLEARARRLLEGLASILPEGWRARIEASDAVIGGGSLPDHRLRGSAVVLCGGSVTRLAQQLRGAPTPLLARLQDDALWLDVRTLKESELAEVVEAVRCAFVRGV